MCYGNRKLSGFNRINRRISIERSGNTFIGYHSPNGVNWQIAFSAVVPMNSCVEIGLIMESINGATTTTGTFEFVEVTGVTPARPVFAEESETEVLSDILVYPNPSSGQVNIDLGNQAGMYKEVQIVNSLGQTVDSKNLNKERFHYFDLNLRPGLYTLIFEENGDQKVKRLIIH